MFPFWDLVIAPVFDAVGARRVVEIGALRGNTTELMLDRLGAEAELHVIDPVPQFDPGEHERAFPGRYHFHRGLSVDVLPELPPVDVALVDGDHNWYTVYNELQALAATSAAHDEPLPVLILHDVSWPYGRRDLYYAPETIPEEHQQPHVQQGIKPGDPGTLAQGGLNRSMWNATREGGPRNGVMTALEDFLAGYEHPVRLVVIPIYFGLAVVADQRRLASHPALAAVLDRLESRDGAQELLELAESTRLRAMLFQENVSHHRERLAQRTTSRYLDLLKGALLDDHYIENELRIDHLLSCVRRGTPPTEGMLRDPMRWMRDKFQRIRGAHRNGRWHDDKGPIPTYFAYTTMGRRRLDHLQGCLDVVRDEGVEGDLVVCGAGRGGGGVFVRGYLDAWQHNRPTVWVADRFLSTPAEDPEDADAPPPAATGGADLNQVRDAFDRFDLLDERVRFLQGPPADTLPGADIDKVALVQLGAGIGEDAEQALDALYDRLSIGGFVVVEDHRQGACRAAVRRFRERRGIDEPLEKVDWAGVAWRKEEARPADDEAVPAVRPARHAPLVRPRAKDRCDLTVVVVFHDMRREAERTLYSLSRAYQEGVDDLDYEVIAVENGSSPDQRLGERFVTSFGPEFHYIDMKGRATTSPVPALNRGIRAGRGDAFALMIDGAHVLTPGVLHHGMAGLRTYEPAIVATQQWYVGPGQQGDAMLGGYDQAAEDKLFTRIAWPSEGYRLFDIGHFIGERDWLDGLWESNCLFAPRDLLAQVGGFDESFDMPGGGYANLELYERLGSTPDLNVVTILGEGSFHQSHGGTTTNAAEVDERRRRITSYAEHYADLRGRGFRGHHKRISYVGGLTQDICRTRARRRTAALFRPEGPDLAGLPTEPSPMPQDLGVAFTDAWWRTLAWQEASWIGTTVGMPPGDLFAYQELVASLRPDWIVEVGARGGGRSAFLADVAELVGHGRVLSVDEADPADLPTHERITRVRGGTTDEATVAAVRRHVGDDARVLLILGSRQPRTTVQREFDAYAPLVPPGSYAIVEDTIVNGHPVWPDFGPGPAEAARQILAANPDFVVDPLMERYPPTFNPGGFLRRVR